ncbi:MAG: hypothetical protein IT355_03740 [Gemmatimonadaceae bacterium]|nr:hypothetical protein [Gemmatimonadaceae bacterium]
MTRLPQLTRCLAAVLACSAAIAMPVAAQNADSSATTTIGDESSDNPIRIGISGRAGRHGTAIWVDALLIDTLSFGIQGMTQQLGPSTRVYGVAWTLGTIVDAPNWRWLRFEMGMGAYGQTSTKSLHWYQRAGLGYVAGVTAAAFRKGPLTPELHGWAVLATNTQFAGASAGLRVSASAFLR